MKIRVKFKRQIDILYTNLFWRSRFNNIGKRSVIEKPQIINNPKCFSIGDYSRICAGSILADLEPGKGNYPKVKVGNNTVINYRFQCNVSSSVTIGDYVGVATNVLVTDADHVVEKGGKLTQDKKYLSEPVVIGNNCWIGQNVVILKGVKIGDNCVIGASSVVTKDIPSNSIAVGSPAKVVKTIE